MKTLLTLLAALTLASTAQARIGWSLEACKKQYGETEPAQLDGRGESYSFPNAPGSFEIFVSLVDNKVVWITYTKKNYGTITKEDTERLLRLNANGYIWTQTDKPHVL